MNLEEAYGLLNNIYVNFSKSAKGYYVYSYRPQYDTVTKRTLKKDVTSIGKIFSETGLGEIIEPGKIKYILKQRILTKPHQHKNQSPFWMRDI